MRSRLCLVIRAKAVKRWFCCKITWSKAESMKCPSGVNLVHSQCYNCPGVLWGSSKSALWWCYSSLYALLTENAFIWLNNKNQLKKTDSNRSSDMSVCLSTCVRGHPWPKNWPSSVYTLHLFLSAAGHFSFIFHLMLYLPFPCFFISRIDYCRAILAGLPLRLIEQLKCILVQLLGLFVAFRDLTMHHIECIY